MDDYKQILKDTKKETKKKLEKCENNIFKYTTYKEMYKCELANLYYKKFLYRKNMYKLKEAKSNAIFIAFMLSIFTSFYLALLTNPLGHTITTISVIAASLVSLTAAKCYYEVKINKYKKELEDINISLVEEQILEYDNKLNEVNLSLNYNEEKKLSYKKLESELNSIENKKTQDFTEYDISKIKTLEI